MKTDLISRRSFLSVVGAVGAAAALTACGGSSASSRLLLLWHLLPLPAPLPLPATPTPIGICQLVQHAALDAATQGLRTL